MKYLLLYRWSKWMEVLLPLFIPIANLQVSWLSAGLWSTQGLWQSGPAPSHQACCQYKEPHRKEVLRMGLKTHPPDLYGKILEAF